MEIVKQKETDNCMLFNNTKIVKQQKLTGERALFQSRDIKIYDSSFFDGESPLKESKGVDIYNSTFRWKYPLWYCRDIYVEDSFLLETARSGIWYTHNITIKNSVIEAPKTFRKASHITLENVTMPIAQETLWNCSDIELTNVTAKGDYFGFHSQNIVAKNLTITGNYAFDSAKNITVYDSKLVSKDAFWNCENVTVYNSTVIGEYFGWNAKNVTLINCTIESEQGFCYMENLKMINCKIVNTTLAFEYSDIDVESTTHIDSIVNPKRGSIIAPSIGEIIQNDADIDSKDVTITLLKD